MNPTYQIPRYGSRRSIFTFVLALLLSLPMYLSAQQNCTANAGRLIAQESCAQGDSVTLKATSAGDTVVPSGYRVLYVLTGGDSLTILQVNATPSFTVNNPAGLYTLHTLVYNPATLDLSIVVPGQTTGFTVNSLLVQGGGSICASLDVTGSKFRFGGCNNGCAATAGTLKADTVACLRDSVRLTATRVTQPAVPTGYRVLYVLTSGQNLVIEQVNTQPAFTVRRTGRFTLHTLVYNPATLDLSIVVPGRTTGVDVNSLLIQGGGSICAALDVTGAPVNVTACPPAVCTASAGTLVATPGACLLDSSATLTATRRTPAVVPTGYQLIYVLTSGQNLVIEQVNAQPTFTVRRTGRFTIHTLVYNPATLNLGIVVPGRTTGVDVNNLLIQGGGNICASLDVTGAPFDITACPPAACTASAGTLVATPGACLRDSSATLTATRRNPAVVPTGYQLIYVLTSGQNLVIEQVNAQPTFTVRRTGRFTIHTLVYNPATLNLGIVVPGRTTGVDVNNLLIQGGGSICASLDVTGAPFDVAACPPATCTANAGTLKTSNSHVCLYSNAGVTLTATRATQPVVPTGYQVLYVLTSGQNLVIEQVSAQPSFLVKRPGRFTIHTLVYNPATLNLGIVVLGQTTGVTVNSLLVQGGGSICASLDVAGAKIDVADCRCAADAGKLNYTRSGGSIVNLFNGRAFLAGNTTQAPVVPRGYQKIYVLTSGDNLVIEQVNHIPVFVVNRTGIFRIHTLIYDPNTLNLGIVVPGQTTGVDVNNLLIQGGGNICAALDVAGLRFQVRNSSGARASTYPNPAVDFVNIELLQLENIQRIAIEIVDVNGNLVKQVQLEGNAELANLDIASLNNGLYFVRIKYDDQFEQQVSITKMK